MKVTSDQFVKKWKEAADLGHNISWVARQLGIGETPVRNRAKRMRRQGVNLPELAKYRMSEAKRLNGILEQGLES